ncbi:hypothetical protein FHW67_002733 [Herbaspirillum sp. Sphag1AN]|uniref:hypothetical protein n=1 Tax=unclassified Herbaspirillum TaxID=2624150 RepID=UPI0016118E2A|nr:MULTISPECIES: hypothetical protein [unclassified Herbaspirillum]MBB3213441.1 hypothetical protein [Herbaspirillum sp. Sphag1AN]MBB3246515.1 hypothetical protein [Herbaspirillum sp. Sphag64]
MRDYGKVYTAFWSSEDIRDLSEDGRMLALYLMTFKSAYARLVTDARNSGTPITWSVSLGFDKQKQVHAIQKAEVAGLLSAPTVSGLLPNYSIEKNGPSTCPEGLKRIKEMMSVLDSKRAQRAEERARTTELERAQVQQKKDAMAALVIQRMGDSRG